MSNVGMHRRATPGALALALLVAVLLPPGQAAAQSTPDTNPSTLPIGDGTGGPSTLTAPSNTVTSLNAQTTVAGSTGYAQSSFAFQLPKARGDAQPSLGLTYSSGASTVVGFAGAGWTLNVSSIVRRGAAGLPLFTDDVFTASPAALASLSATFDDYLADGQVLVPVCFVASCSNLVLGEKLPTSLVGTSLSGWVYFRREVDDGARYFFSPGGQTWLKQERSGVVSQFGRPLDAAQVDPSLGDGIERPSPSTQFVSTVTPSAAVYRWDIVRQTDATGNNTVYYAWTNNAFLAPGGTVPDIEYLSDVYDTLAVGQPVTPGAFAHHVHLTWQLDWPLQPVLSAPPPSTTMATPALIIDAPICIRSTKRVPRQAAAG